MRYESQLGFGKYTVASLSYITRRFSHEGKMNTAQLKGMLENLHLNWANWDKDDSPIGQFLAKIKLDDDIDEESIRFCAMMLSKSANADKAQMFWEVIDPAAEGKAGKGAFEDLFQKLIEIVGDKTYVLSKASQKKGEYDQVADYVKNLNETATIAKGKIIASFFSDDEISKETFMEKFKASDEQFGSLFTPKGLRAFMKKVYDETPAAEKGSVAAVNDMFANFV